MEQTFEFTQNEKNEALAILARLKEDIGDTLKPGDERKLHEHIIHAISENKIQRDIFGLNPILHALQPAEIATHEVGLKRDGAIAVILYNCVQHDMLGLDNIEADFGQSVANIINGLIKVQSLYRKNPVVESENFRNLLLSFAEDMRVILIMIADRVNMMRQIKDTPYVEAQRQVSEEASYLYAPLAHKLGLYKLKSELEDLSLKYLEHDAYYMIKEKLNATKRSRDAYIEKFIKPIQQNLEEAGLHFHMKGRTKSIHSIWQKMKKQKCGFEGIYDLFAIRIIIDSPLKLEKMQCWQAFSIVTDMYQPNPKRLRDWLSVPKSNGYESLHITVLGPDNKWVEVQIRTERMDDLEAGDDLEVMDQFKMDLYDDEVFIFTPKGDLIKFPKGATVLDFAYHIHTGVGNSCVGGRINGKVVPFRQQLNSGDTVEIITQTNQKPKRDWLNIVKTSRAKAKIRLALKETQKKEGLMAKELLERRFKNRKIEPEESIMGQLITKMGFKEQSDFYKQIADEKLDPNAVIEKYLQIRDQTLNAGQQKPTRSAEEFEYENPGEDMARQNDDALIIDRNLMGIDYSLAQCCRPIYGDSIFGFVTVSGGIKIHRTDCPNAPELYRRFGYRVVKARWSGKGNGQYAITLRVIGNDDIGIVNNITSIISKEEKIIMRSINIDSNDGLFRGNLVVQLEDVTRLNSIIKKLQQVKGVKQVTRL